jgi:uncharacterized protein (TIGR02391 family)
MANQDQIDLMMRYFPPEAELLQMSAEDVGMHLLKYMTRSHAETNRFNFLQMVTGGQVSFRFMEGWGWLVRQGFLALAPNDMYGKNHFVTREGIEVAQQDDLDAWRKAHLFPDYFDAALQRWVKPLFSRGDYDTAVFRAIKEVETRVRKKSGFKTDYGRGLMLKAFGETGPLMASDNEGRKAAREMFAGAISFCKNPSSHHEIDFDDPREVVDMISFANQLLRIVDRL